MGDPGSSRQPHRSQNWVTSPTEFSRWCQGQISTHLPLSNRNPRQRGPKFRTETMCGRHAGNRLVDWGLGVVPVTTDRASCVHHGGWVGGGGTEEGGDCTPPPITDSHTKRDPIKVKLFSEITEAWGRLATKGNYHCKVRTTVGTPLRPPPPGGPRRNHVGGRDREEGEGRGSRVRRQNVRPVTKQLN